MALEGLGVAVEHRTRRRCERLAVEPHSRHMRLEGSYGMQQAAASPEGTHMGHLAVPLVACTVRLALVRIHGVERCVVVQSRQIPSIACR